jgi:RNA polymerase sigma-54 factor
MSMGLGMGMSFGQHMSMRASPSLIAFTQILQLSGLQLQQAIQAAVADNPALELVETDLCPACGDPLLEGGVCLRCRRGEDLASAAARALTEPLDEDDELDVFARVPDQMSLPEHVLAELAAVLADEDLPIAEYLLGELDDRGFLTSSVEEVAATLGISVERVRDVLLALQAVGPVGIGARTVEECLGLQLDRWAALGVTNALARTLVTEHLDDLGRGQYGRLARALGVSHDDIVGARDFVRTHLRPYPIADEIDLKPWERQSGTGFIAPDVIVRLDKDGAIDVVVVESRRYALSISPLYRDYYARLDAGRPLDARLRLSDRDVRHITEHVSRARQFMTFVHERRETMRRVTAYVMARQTEYLRHGPRFLLPLTRAEVADALDLHESTVSRATAGKYVLVPSRHVVAFSTFFKAALSVQDVLREIVGAETTPLTDTELVAELAARGYRVARRTVAKYRTAMGILPSSLR